MSKESAEEQLRNMDYEARQNLVGFVDLLLKIDMRVNPHLYEDNGDTDNTD